MLPDRKVKHGVRWPQTLQEACNHVVSSLKMYGVAADADGQPYVMRSSKPYDNIGTVKRGPYSSGSGTSPTIMANGKYVSITDNGEQLHVVVYRTAEKLGPNEDRIV